MASNNYDRYNNYAYSRQQQQAQSTTYGTYSDTRSSAVYQPATSVAQSNSFTSANVPRQSYAPQPAYTAVTSRPESQWYGTNNNQNATSYDRNASKSTNLPRTDSHLASANAPSSTSYRPAYGEASQAPATVAQGSTTYGTTAHAPAHARGDSQQQQHGNYQQRAASTNSVSSAGSHQPAAGARMQQNGTGSNNTTAQARSPRQYQQGSSEYQSARAAAARTTQSPGATQYQQHEKSHQYANQDSQSQHQQHRQSQDRRSTPASNEGNSVTVDPTQVYDNSHELQRQAAKRRAEAEVVRRVEEARKKAEVEKKAQEAETAKKSAAAAGGQAKPKAKKNKLASEANAPGTPDDAASAAALTLMQTANTGNSVANDPAALEAQMKDMFAAMRKFNAANPEMLSRLWAQEREAHLATAQAEQPPSTAAPTSTSKTESLKPRSEPKVKKAATSKPQPSQTPTTPASGTASAKDPTATANPAAAATAQTTAPKSTGTIWPADKKAALADAVLRLITQTPENRGKTLNHGDIANILDSNPSYDQLCTQLENRGLKVDKFKFARALLSAVPGVSKSKAGATASAQASTSGAAPAPADSAVNNLMTTASIVDTPSKKGGQPRKDGPSSAARTEAGSQASSITAPGSNLEGLDAIKNFNERASVASVTSTANSTVKQKAARQRPPVKSLPATKEDQARKRTFHDLVDLTTLSDDDPPAKKLHIGEQLPSPLQTVAADSDTSNRAQQLQAPTNQGPQHTVPAPVRQSQPQQQAAPTPVMQDPTTQQRPKDLIPWGHPLKTIVVAEKLDKRDAIRRSTYNVKTIARDVLLACGRHPDMRHLNAHLEKLRVNLPHVKDDTDLSTIRWDVVDPGGLPPGSNVVEESADVEVDFADDEDDTDSVMNEPRIGAPTEALGPGSTAVLTGQRTATLASGPPKKVGRLPTTNPVFHGFAGGPSTSTPNQRPNPATTSHSARQASSGASTYSALRAQQLNAGETPTRGRPKGWRKWMQKDAPAGSSSHPTSKTPKSTTKKPKSPSPEFPVFECAWQSCQTQLHNLSTLRRHLHKLHCAPTVTLGDPSGESYPCEWGSCGTVRSMVQGPRTVSKFTRHTFPSATVWRGHMEAEHLRPIAWELGDGPAAGASDRGESAGELSEAFLSDREGRRVTPRVEMPESAAHAVTRARETGTADEMPPKARQGKKPTAEEEARAEEFAAKERRRRLGSPGIDVAGEGVVSRGIREGFDDQTEAMDVVDEA